MAQRRMFSLKIVDTDMFLDMPLSAQNLYFHLNMRADDDGFIANHKKIMRMIGCNDDDMKILLAKDFIIPFESGVCVIKHWKIHNYIQKDRYTETLYHDEKEQLQEDKNKMYTKCIQPVHKLDTQVRLELGKSKSKSNIDYTLTDSIIDYFNQKTGKKLRRKDISRKPIKARLNEGFTIEDCKKVINTKYDEWIDDENMSKYIRISTLFGNKFEVYLNQVTEKKLSASAAAFMHEAFKRL